MDLKSRINIDKLPQHVAIIMDGNGRWAQEKGLSRVLGHKSGVKAVREITEASAELGISYLTLYAFSTENWDRPKEEVDALMELLVETINVEISTLNENDIRLNAIGNIADLPPTCRIKLQEAIDETSDNSRMTLTLALSYSSRWEITEAIKSIVKKVEQGQVTFDGINEQLLETHLTTYNMPAPELLIRTSGERRVSNFLLWQIAYSELYFTDVLWPDFGKEKFYQALLDYEHRERRFGKTSEQVKGL